MRAFVIYLFVSFGSLSLAFAQEAAKATKMIDLIRNKPGFASEIPATVCNEIFPFHKFINS